METPELGMASRRPNTRHTAVYTFTLYMYDIPRARTGVRFFSERMEPLELEVKCLGVESSHRFYPDLIQVSKGHPLHGAEEARFLKALREMLHAKLGKHIMALTPDLIDYGGSNG